MRLEVFKRRWDIYFVNGALDKIHISSITEGMKIIINRIESVYYIVFKDKKGEVGKIKIESKIYSSTNEYDLIDFFTEEGKLNHNYYKFLGEHVFKKIGFKGNYKNPWDLKVGFLEEDLFDLTFSHLRVAKLLYKNPFTCFCGAFLLHLSLECYLEACCLFENDEFPAIHKLKTLVEKITFLKLNISDKNFIEELDKRYYFRYLFDEVGNSDLKDWYSTFDSIKT